MSPKAFAIILAVILAVSGLYLAEQYWLKPATEAASGAGPALMGELPEATLYDRDGNPVALSSFRGKTLVINFWATWCLPCIVEMPFLNRVYNEFRDQDVVFIGISEDAGGWEDIIGFLDLLKDEKDATIDYPILLDEGQQAGEAFGGVYGLPNTFFVNRDGRITRRHIGIIDIDDLRDSIRDMLAAPAAENPSGDEPSGEETSEEAAE